MLMLAALMTLATGARDFQEHWLQPLIFFVPLLLATWIDPAARRGLLVFRGLALLVLMGVTLALPGQALFANPQRPSRLNLPYTELAAEIQTMVGEPDVIVASTVPLAGNLRLQFPDSRVSSPRTQLPLPETAIPWLVVSETPLTAASPFTQWLMSEFQVGAPQGEAKVSAALNWLPDQVHHLYWSLLTPDRLRH
jgi:hypothetical protein